MIVPETQMYKIRQAILKSNTPAWLLLIVTRTIQRTTRILRRLTRTTQPENRSRTWICRLLIPTLTQQQQALVDHKNNLFRITGRIAGKRALVEIAQISALSSRVLSPYSTPQPTHTLLDFKGLNSTVEKELRIFITGDVYNVMKITKLQCFAFVFYNI